MKKITLFILAILAVLVLTVAGCAVTTVSKHYPGGYHSKTVIQSGWEREFKIGRIPAWWHGDPSRCFFIEDQKDSIPNHPEKADVLAWGGEAAEYIVLPGNIPGYFLKDVNYWIDRRGPIRIRPEWDNQFVFQIRRDRETTGGYHLIRVVAVYVSPKGLEAKMQERFFWTYFASSPGDRPDVFNP